MKPTTQGRPVRFALALAGTVMALSAFANGAAVAQDTKVSYSADQSERGKKNYDANCAECHGEDLKGGLLGGAGLRGLAFEEKYFKGAPAGALFEVMQATMPPNAPGRYSPKVYAELMAYILDRNGVKAGAELPTDIDALYSLVMEK
jgi:mono/diheme cytochrome c family protein